jgi:predicted Zn-dependent protease
MTGRAMAALLLAATAAGCGDSVGEGACYEPNTDAYAFHAPGDTSIVFRWPSSYSPVRVYAEPVGALVADVDSAMWLWAGAFRCGEIALTRVTDSMVADIILRAPVSMPPLPATAAAVMSASPVGACRGRTDVLLDTLGRAQRPFRSYIVPSVAADSADAAACAQFVTAHELGHALGLFSHSPDPDDLMYQQPYRRELTPRDRYTVELLYHTTPTVAPTPR